MNGIKDPDNKQKQQQQRKPVHIEKPQWRGKIVPCKNCGWLTFEIELINGLCDNCEP